MVAATVPVENGHLLWSRKVAAYDIGEGNEIIHSNGHFYISDERCNVHVLDQNDNEVAKLDGDETTSCSSPMAFSLDSSFFIQTQHFLDSETPFS